MNTHNDQDSFRREPSESSINCPGSYKLAGEIAEVAGPIIKNWVNTGRAFLVHTQVSVRPGDECAWESEGDHGGLNEVTIALHFVM